MTVRKYPHPVAPRRRLHRYMPFLYHLRIPYEWDISQVLTFLPKKQPAYLNNELPL